MKFMHKTLFPLACGVLFLMAGCSKDEKLETENLRIPRLMLESAQDDFGSFTTKRVTLPMTQETITVAGEALVNEFEIINIELVKVDLGLALLIQVNESGGKKLYRASVDSLGDRVVFTINGSAVGARRFDGALSNGALYTFTELPDDELGELVLEVKETINQLQKQKSKKR
ncbi:MAG: hypothetical protein ACON5O_08595 [Lentimonas sp.]